MQDNRRKPIFLLPALLLLVVPNVYASENINSDDTMINDIPPDGEGLFCDHTSHPGSCYDRNDNAGDFCLRYPEYTAFCKVIHICSWKVGDDVIEKWREICTNDD